MILLYSGASAPNQTSNSQQSVGGFISSTTPPNNLLHNLFSQITRSSLINNQEEYKLVVLKNTTTVTTSLIKIWTEVLSEWFTIEIAAIAPGFDEGCNRYYFEQLASPFQAPFQAVFSLHEGETNSLNITTPLEPNKFIGIWVRRKLKSEKLEQFTLNTNNQNCTEQSILDLQEQISSIQSQEKFNLIIDFS